MVIEQNSTDEYSLERLIDEIISVRKKQKQVIDMVENFSLDMAMVKGQLTQVITLVNSVLLTLQKTYAAKVSVESKRAQTTNLIKLDDLAQLLQENPILYNVLRLKNKGLIEVLKPDESNQIPSESKQESKESDKENKEESWY